MQMYWNKAFTSRMLFNASKAFVRQLDGREDYQLLEPVYGLALIDDTIDNHHTHFYHHYKIVNLEHTNEVIHGMEFVLIELPLFKPETWMEKRVAVLWLRFLKELNEKTQTVAAELLANEDVHRAIDLCREGAFNDAEMYAYDRYWDVIRREISMAKVNLEEGIEKGIEKGIEQGRADLIRQMLANGMAPADAAKFTGLPLAEIETI
jgi:predicted transposase/invertase (TIGR01784 family)